MVVTVVENMVETRSGTVSYAEIGAGAPLIILHSLLTDRRAFDPVIEHLGGRVIAIDLPGYGATTPAEPTIDSYAVRVVELIAAMGFEPSGVTLIGNGLGAFVALGTAIQAQVGRLILVGSGRSFPEGARQAFANMAEAARTGGMEAVIPTALLRIFTEDHLARHPEAAAERAEVLRGIDVEGFIIGCEALRAVDYGAAASTIEAPTLIVVGEQDRATPPSMAEELHSLMPVSELTVMPGVAHAPQLQDPQGFLNVVGPYLRSR